MEQDGEGVMDAVRFVEDFGYICSHYDCQECPLYNERCDLVGTSQKDAEKIVAIVEQWSKEHPPMTNRQKFKEVFGTDAIYMMEKFHSGWLGEEYMERRGN